MVPLTGFALLATAGVLLGVAAAIAKVKLLRAIALVALFGVYGTLLGFWLVAQVGHLFLSRATQHELSDLGWWLTPFYTLGSIIWAVWPPRRRKIWTTVLAFVVGLLVFNFTWPLTRLSDRLYVQRHQAQLDSLVADIIAYGRIRQMDYDYLPSVNGTFVLGAALDSTSHLKPVPLATILTRDSIDPKKHADYQRRLAGLHFMAFWAESEQVTLVRNRGSGLLYQSRHSTLKPGDRLGNNGRIVQVLAPRWYYTVW